MNIGLIDVSYLELDENTLKSKAIGGSESWFLQTAHEFSKKHKVTLYCNTPAEKTVGNTTYVPIKEIVNNFYKRPKFDFVILNRIIHRFNMNFIALIKQYEVTESVFMQVHDLSLVWEGGTLDTKKVNMDYTLIMDPIVKGIVILGEWHKQNLIWQYPQIKDKVYCIPNGVDLSLFTKTGPARDNRILWSSCPDRGLDILINNIYPIVKSVIPDFGIDVASYQQLNIDTQDKDVKLLGGLQKYDLYREMMKHKVWFYPGTFAETFCITMIENIMCGCYPVSPFTYGMKDVIGEELYKKNAMNNRFPSQEAIVEAANRIIAILRGDKVDNIDPNVDIVALQDRAKQFTWKNTASKYIELYERTKHSETNKYKGIFLAMYCNEEMYVKEEQIVQETWAKALIDNKFPGYAYFSFTSCDEQHPQPCIDGHRIYVNVPNDINHTYSKMKAAYEMLLESGNTFDWIFRTNTSTFLNIPLLLEGFKDLNWDDVMSERCPWGIKYSDGRFEFKYNLICGNGYWMSRKFADKVFLTPFDESLFGYFPAPDDVIVAAIVDYLRIPYHPVELANTVINNQPQYYRYKCYNEEDKEKFASNMNVRGHEARCVSDPSIVKTNRTVSTRTLYDDHNERMERGHELELMYELYEQYKTIL